MRRGRWIVGALLLAIAGYLLVLETAPSGGPVPAASATGCVWACSTGACVDAPEAAAPLAALAAPVSAATPGLRVRRKAPDAPCPPGEAAPEEPAQPAKPFEVSGAVLDEQGRPLRDARISWRAGFG